MIFSIAMHDLPTTIILTLMTILSLLASALAVMRLGCSGATSGSAAIVRWLVVICGALGGLLFFYRATVVHRDWVPLEAHVDGLLLIATLLAMTVLFLEVRARMSGVAAFALPLLTVLLAWSICASWFTFELFHRVDIVWKAVHLASNYLGTLFFVIAAGAGGMFLYAHSRLRNKNLIDARLRFASLEAIERLIVRTATLGFALLSLGVVMGVIDATIAPRHSGLIWWIKIGLGTVVWVIFGTVMNVRHASAFRGSRAAWMSIAGTVLIMATIAVSLSIPHVDRPGSGATPSQPPTEIP